MFTSRAAPAPRNDPILFDLRVQIVGAAASGAAPAAVQSLALALGGSDRRCPQAVRGRSPGEAMCASWALAARPI